MANVLDDTQRETDAVFAFVTALKEMPRPVRRAYLRWLIELFWE